MVDEREWEAAVEAAWVSIRGEVADALAELEDGRGLVLEWGEELVEGLDPEEGGAAPYIQAVAFGGTMVRIEAVSDHYLDERFELGEQGADALSVLGFQAPTVDPAIGESEGSGSSNHWCDLEGREADRGAVMIVRALREVYGCLHPSLLATTGVRDEADESRGSDADARGESDVVAVGDLRTSWPSSPDELEEALLTALGAFRGEPVERDDDGDVPIRVGRSMAFVRVHSHRPAVELFAHMVLDLEHADAATLARELNILNRSHLTTKFYSRGGLVVARQVLIASPFVPAQMRVALDSFCDDLDQIAGDLVERVGGRRFFDDPAEDAEIWDDYPDGDGLESSEDPPDESIGSPALAALIEMLRDGRLPTRSVVALFDADRHGLVGALAAVRSGGVSCAPVEDEVVLHALRRATRAVARAETERPRGDRPLPERPRRLSVLDEDGTDRRRA